MLVSTFVFVLLGTLLVQAVVGGVSAWRIAEARRQVYERAQLVYSTLDEDLGSVFCLTRHGRDPEVRLRLQRDRSGNADLRFVRTIAGELSREETRHAGEQAGAKGYRNLHGDHHKRLLAGEGLEEVLYVVRQDEVEETPVLWRGIRSPIGGEGSLLTLDLQPARSGVEDPLPLAARPFVHGVLHFGIELWVPGRTVSWLHSPGGRGSPETAWDTLEEPGTFPILARVTLVLACDPILARTTRLSQGIGVGDSTVAVDSIQALPEPGRDGAYVRVDQEWVRYTGRDLERGRLTGCTRAQRASRASAHPAGSRVEIGYTFVNVYPLRGAR
jgi:hypothetical protein